MSKIREPEHLRRGKEFHKRVQKEWLNNNTTTEEEVVSEKLIIKPSGRKGRVDIFINSDDPLVAIAEIKSSDWDRMTLSAVHRNVRRQTRQVWDYIESQLKLEKDVSPGIIFSQRPKDHDQLILIEKLFEDEGIQVVWKDESIEERKARLQKNFHKCAMPKPKTEAGMEKLSITINGTQSGHRRDLIMKKGITLLAVFVITVILASGFAITVSAELVSQSNVKSSSIIYVPDDYAMIQWAVDNASAGNTLIVRDGTYTENVDVDKSLTLRSENGSAYTIVYAANLTDPLFEVTANYVNISGFTVDATEWWMPWSPTTGIYLNNANHCNISRNNISNSRDGIKLVHSSNNLILNNYLHNSDNGVLLEISSNNNSVSNNSMLGINNGIYLEKSSNNEIMENNIVLCYWFGYGKAGIHLEKSSNNRIRGNDLSSYYHWDGWRYGSEEIGIYLSSSSNTKITNNSFKNDGIFISGTEVYHYNSHIIENNAANEKPIYYYKNTNGIRVPEDAGEVILANCTNMTVENVNVSSSSVGVEIAYTEKSLISNINASNKNYYGLFLYNSSNITVSNSEANGNFNGIYIEKSRYNKIINNDISHNRLLRGICLKYDMT